MTRGLFSFVFGTAGAASWNAAALAQEAPEAPADLALPTKIDKSARLTFAELREGIVRWHSRLLAIEIEYYWYTRVFYSDLFPGHGSISSLHRHFAFKGEKRFLTGMKIVDGKLDQEPGSAYAFDEISQQDYYAHLKEGNIRSSAGKQNVLDVDPYVYSLGIPLRDAERAAAATSDLFLPHALDLVDHDWRVESKLQLVEGVECHVLSSRYKQRIWIDPSIGYGIRFRERYQGGKHIPKVVWLLETRRVFREFDQVEAGLWLPRSLDTVTYAGVWPISRWNSPAYSTSIRVSRLAVNDRVPDKLFKLSFPPGTRVRDEIQDRCYRVGNANEELDFW